MFPFFERHIIFTFFSIFTLISLFCLVMHLISKDPAQKKRTLTVTILTAGFAFFLFLGGHKGSLNSTPDAIFDHFNCSDTKITVLHDMDDIYFVEACGKKYTAKPFFGFIRANESSYILPDSGFMEMTRGGQ
ncbi:hypothetical protein [Paenibacillus taichungensis]